MYLMPPSASLREAQQLRKVSERLDTLANQHPSSQKRSSPSQDTCVTPPRCWRCLVATKIGR
jgi:hypothetical protein